MNKNLLYLGIILVIFLIVIWGYYLYTISYPKNGTATPTKQTPTQQTKTTTQTPANQQTSTSFTDGHSLFNFFALEKPSEKDRANFDAALNRFAKENETVSVNKCETIPVVLKAKMGKEIKFKNNDQADYTLIIKNNKYSLPAGQTISITPNFGAGVYGYHCEGKGYEDRVALGLLSGILDIVE